MTRRSRHAGNDRLRTVGTVPDGHLLRVEPSHRS